MPHSSMQKLSFTMQAIELLISGVHHNFLLPLNLMKAAGMVKIYMEEKQLVVLPPCIRP
ncbi:hypothetical protein D3C71_1747320 [compost metagenome]